MRKGRSQRKTRGSLPPTSKRPLSRLAGSAAPSSGGPQVVVGHAAPREEYLDETPRTPPQAEALAETRETRSEREVREPTAPVAQLELVAEAERLELVREESLEIQHDERDEQEHEQTARVETLTFDIAEASSSDFEDESVNARAATPVKAESQVPHATSLPTPDEMSIPPMGDLSVEPIADRFFSEGELVAAGADHESEEWDERANKAVRKSLPEVVQRRARFAKYVRWAVGGAAVLCLAALARSAVPTSAPSASASLAQSTRLEAPAAKAASVAVVAPVAVVAATPVKAADAVSAPVVAVPAAVPAEPVAAPVATVAPAPAEVAPVKAAEPAVAAPADAPAAPAVATSDKTALQEKNDSRRALERGKLADAIAAGERSVALDATDGEAWLLLGAAYQEKGKNAEARRCYSSCVKEGKRGPLGECRALIH